MPLADFTPHFHQVDGLCHPDWYAIGAVIGDMIGENAPDEELHQAWDQAAIAWLQNLRATLGADYRLDGSKNFLLLSAKAPTAAADILRTCEDSLEEILDRLEGSACDEGFGRNIVLMFSRAKDYYRYIAPFYPEGDSPMSGGICIHRGYTHIVLPGGEFSSHHTALVHELTHNCLRHLPLPAWLNEALAMRMEQLICGTATFQLDREIHRRHLAHWNEETIQEFWSGHSWSIPGDSFELSYNLAQVLWRKIEVGLGAPPDAILDFVTAADFQDAGEAAFQEIFELSLADLAEDFLGTGDWLPTPDRWPAEPYHSAEIPLLPPAS